VNASSRSDGALLSGPLRILHVFRAPIGGLFRHVRDLAAEQTRMGHDVGIVCDATTGGKAAEEKLQTLSHSASLGISRVAMSRTLSHRDVTATAVITRRIAEIQPHVVHGHGAKGGAYARLARRATTRIALCTPHGGVLHYRWGSPAGAVFLALERRLRGRTDGMLFESNFGAREYAAKIGDISCPWRVVPNGLCEADFAPLPPRDTAYDAVFVGELRDLKGVATLIDAVSLLQDKSFRLGIAGTGPDEARFRAQVAEHGLTSRVDFLGHRPASDVFALGRMVIVPSLAESFPYIVLEAIAAGLPLIATRVGGIPEIFGPHASQLIAPGDPQALAAAVLQAAARPEAALRLANALRLRALTLYSASRMACDVTLFYREVASARPHAAVLKTPETTPV
jgi:glycosyltransferase involved in cell wall biosynthesis